MYEATVSALCYSLVRALPTADRQEFYNNEIVRYVLDQHRRMPDYLRLAITIFTCAFDLWGITTGCRLFHNLPPDTRARQIQSWKEARWRPMRDLIRVYESLTILFWYSKQRYVSWSSSGGRDA